MPAGRTPNEYTSYYIVYSMAGRKGNRGRFYQAEPLGAGAGAWEEVKYKKGYRLFGEENSWVCFSWAKWARLVSSVAAYLTELDDNDEVKWWSEGSEVVKEVKKITGNKVDSRTSSTLYHLSPPEIVHVQMIGLSYLVDANLNMRRWEMGGGR
ncbi:uncharacterized protein B0T23DRAFT_325588 [Neurospora hispaniola]|uniref:Uncharacterized protein n=1 Tax=Neurospora hispaniola TaxID=588809 RepID=A0AAJ0HZD2_9PEZI|nr:hypothetical protein B0T23DRAFT_325588 [Neurospora hispaniola]